MHDGPPRPLFAGRIRVPEEPRVRFALQGGLDVLAWAVAIFAALVLRYEFNTSSIAWQATAGLILLTGVVHLSWGWPMRLFQGRYAYGSFEEVRALAAATLGTGCLMTVPVLLFGREVGLPRSTVLMALPLALVLMLCTRYLVRLLRESRTRPRRPTEPAVLFGAGYIGRAIVHRLLTDGTSQYHPVALLDDDPLKRHSRIRDVDVLGTLDDLAEVVEATGARVLIMTIARADASLIRRVADAAQPLALEVKVVPPLDEILGGRGVVGDLRDLSIEDLVGRHPVDTNIDSIAGYLGGRRVLVTGAGGSIGVELCRQIHAFGPAELVMLDRDETGLQAAQLTVSGHGLLNSPDVVLADLRDAETLERIFLQRRPEVVFHAGALKHLPMLQQYPEEAWKTNVIGTLNVLRAARAAGVSTFVNISTDKAADPISVLGRSKRLAERLTAWMGEETGRGYLSVRFGNVIGSRGSMVPLFTSMIEQGGPVTITHPEVSRYFMTIPEACQLVVQAGAIGAPGEVLILDMGEPVRILDVARRMIELSGRRIDIIFTGLREGEKLHEILVAPEERDGHRVHPKIFHSRVTPLSPDDLDHLRWLAEVREHLGVGDQLDEPTSVSGGVR